MSSTIPIHSGGRIKVVGSFDELVSTPFRSGINALCWQRTLAGDFGEVVGQLLVGEGITTIDEAALNALTLSSAGQLARDVLIEDLRLLETHGLQPVLDCIHDYARDAADAIVSTDVFSFHADSAPVAVDTWLCTYSGPSSEGLLNEAAQRRVDLPETRAALLREFGGADDAAFIEYLRENCYDLHYAPLSGAQSYSFGVGNLWRIALEYPGSPVPPCLHRAPAMIPGQPPRLLLIS